MTRSTVRNGAHTPSFTRCVRQYPIREAGRSQPETPQADARSGTPPVSNAAFPPVYPQKVRVRYPDRGSGDRLSFALSGGFDARVEDGADLR